MERPSTSAPLIDNAEDRLGLMIRGVPLQYHRMIRDTATKDDKRRFCQRSHFTFWRFASMMLLRYYATPWPIASHRHRRRSAAHDKWQRRSSFAISFACRKRSMHMPARSSACDGLPARHHQQEGWRITGADRGFAARDAACAASHAIRRGAPGLVRLQIHVMLTAPSTGHRRMASP